MKTIRELWNEQADEHNQFDELGKDEVEEFANLTIENLVDDLRYMSHTVIEYTAPQLTAHKDAVLIKHKYKTDNGEVE